MEDYDKFSNWYNKFISNKDSNTFADSFWFDSVSDEHADIRSFLGGESVSFDINIKNESGPADPEKAKDIIKQIKELIPNKEYLRHQDEGYVTDKQLLYPTIQWGSHFGMKTSKCLNRAFTDSNSYGEFGYQLIPKEKTDKFNKLLSQLSKLWAKQKTTAEKYTVKLDTSPQGFIMLGHYGPDVNSCFRMGGQREDDKFTLGELKNTYVVTISKDKCLARMWGFSNDKYDTFNVCNVYQKGMKEGNIIAALKGFFAKLTKVNPSDIHLHEDSISIQCGVYHNGNEFGSYTFSTKKRIGLQKLRGYSMAY